MKASYFSFLSILFFIPILSFAQNLVPNPSFEDLDGSVNCEFVASSLEFNNMIEHWVAPTYGSPDLHSKNNPAACWSHCTPANSYTGSTCFRGPQYPRTGDYMCGIQLYKVNSCTPWREYIQVQLTTPLVPGVSYYARLYYSLSDYSPDAVDKLGMYFSTTAISQPNGCPNFNFTPQVSSSGPMTDIVNWVKIEGTFTASAAHQFLTIGNFEASTTNIYSNGGSCTNKGAYYYIDDIYVIEEALLGIEQQIEPTFSIVGNVIEDQLIITPEINSNNLNLVISDISGRIVDQFQLTGKTFKDASFLTPGLYFIRATNAKHKALRFIKM